MPEDDAWRTELEEERRQKDDFMARHTESPFVSARVPFHPLRYFPPDPAFKVTARLERLPVPQEAFLRTNRDGSAVMRYLGDLTFSLGGRPLRLRLYHAGEGVGTSVFVPFRDSTSGRESYGPGRYLTLELVESDEYELDFNRAFNPYCAYTDDFECGFPPAENDLPVPVRAGEKVWAADRNPRTPSSVVLEKLAALKEKAAPRSTAAGTARSGRSRRTARPRRRAAARARASSPSSRRARAAPGAAGRSGRPRTSPRSRRRSRRTSPR
jgi:uncharacterized protein